MTTDTRRSLILEKLNNASGPIPAKDLASEFGVSRQVIVQDLAVIRASVEGIISTNRGYIIQAQKVCTREFKVQHGLDRTRDELNLIVDCGGAVKNVSISHTVYNRVTAHMDISSRQDVEEFMKKLDNSKSSLLGNATSGYHYHLIEASSDERLDLIEEKLAKAGFLASWQEWERQA